jgi:hypothetical protein
MRPLWAEGVVDVAVASGWHDETSRDGRGVGNVLDDAQTDELGSGIS